MFGWQGDSLQRAMDSPCYVNCPTLKTQSISAMNQCTIPTVVDEPIDGCKHIFVVDKSSTNANTIVQGSRGFRDLPRVFKRRSVYGRGWYDNYLDGGREESFQHGTHFVDTCHCATANQYTASRLMNSQNGQCTSTRPAVVALH